MNRTTFQRLHQFCATLLLLTGAGGASCAPKPEGGYSSVWVAEKDGHRLYLAGTIHLLRAGDYPLPEVFEQAYQDSKTLVFELPPGGEDNLKVAEKMREVGSYPQGDGLSKRLDAETMAKVKAWAAKNSFPLAAVESLRPWFLALTIAAVEYQGLGADAKRGVDSHFEQRAKKDGKLGEGLETVDFQLAMFSSLGEKLQEELLRQTFTEVETLPKDFDDLIAAWRTGDVEKLQGFMFRDAEKYPELMEEFLIKRNKSWIAPLLKIMQRGETAMVLVGAGHLGGTGGVLELLEKEGCVIRKLGAPAH